MTESGSRPPFKRIRKNRPVRILLATDAASEGIDLQNHCHRLIHYEIPWNPNRLEQRNGRVDRHGQKAKAVLIYHFVGRGWNERKSAIGKPGDLEGDLEFLMRAAQKVENIRQDLGKVGPVIAERVQRAMLGHDSGLDTTVAEREAAAARKMYRFERNVRDQIAKLRDRLQESRRELRVSPETARSRGRGRASTRGSAPTQGSPHPWDLSRVPPAEAPRHVGALRGGVGASPHAEDPAHRLRPPARGWA